MSISVSRLALPRVLKVTFALLIGTLGQSLFAQQVPAAPSPAKAAPALTISGKVASSNVTQTRVDAAAQKRAELQYLHLPLSFEKNEGQADARVKFLSRGAGYGLFLTDREAVLSFGGQKASSIKLRFLGADAKSTVSAIDRLPGTSNYFLGNDRSKWQTNIPNFGKVEYRNLYSGIDLVYYGNQQKIEHDFVVAPQADVWRIKFAIDGAKKLSLDKSGDLVVATSAGELRLRKPAIYQTINGERREIAGGYALKHRNEVSFVLGAYDRNRELTIDPVLILSTYFGVNTATTTTATGVAVGTDGIYVVGSTNPTTLPPSGATSCSNCGAGGAGDVYVLKTDFAGSPAIYTTYLGGTAADSGTGVAVDASGNAYVVGTTQSSNFPASTVNGFSTSLRGSQDGFLIKLNSTGTQISYGSFIGGDGVDSVNAIALLGSNAYVAGTTDSATNFTFSPNAYQTASSGSSDAFLLAVDTTQTGSPSLLYSSLYGGAGTEQGNAIAAESGTAIYITGSTTSAASTNFPYTAITPVTVQPNGEVGSGTTVTVNAVAHGLFPGQIVTVNGSVIAAFDGTFVVTTVPDADHFTYSSTATGTTDGATIATATPFQAANGGGIDAFIAKFNPTATAAAGSLLAGTFLGAAGDDIANAISVRNSESYVTGSTTSGTNTFPGAPGSTIQNTNAGGTDAFVFKLNDLFTNFGYSTYLGGAATDSAAAIAVDASGNAYVAGLTQSASIFNVNALNGTFTGTQDGFIAKINPAGSSIVYSTYIGGTGVADSASINGMVLNAAGVNASNVPVAVVAGNVSTASGSNFQTTASALQPTATGNNAFVASLDAAPATTATLAFGTNTATPASVRADANNHDQITYQYVIQNTSTTIGDAAHSTVFNDPIPGGVATPQVAINSANFKSGSSPQSCPLTTPTSCSFGAGGVTCHIGTVDDATTTTNSVATVCITATPTDLTPGTIIHNANATAASAETAAVTAATLDTPVDLSTKITTSISQTTPANPVANNAAVTYTVTVTNNGPNDIPTGKVKVTITSAGTNGSTLTLTSLASSDGGDTCVFGTGICTFSGATFVQGTSRTITAIGNVAETSGHQDTITVTPTTAPVNPGDFRFDSGSAQSNNTTTTVQPVANLTTTVANTTPGGGSVTVANNTAGVVYTVNIHNTGDKITTGKVTGNLFSAGVSLNTVAHSVTSGTGTCAVDNTAHTYTCDDVTVDNGTDFTLTLTGTVVETTGKKQVLTVTTNIAPETVNDYGVTGGSTTSASDSNVSVQPVAQLTTSVTTTAATITANNTAGVQYTVTVHSAGPDDISTAHITGSLGDANVSLASSSSSTGVCIVDNTAHTLDCSNVAIANGATFTATLSGTATETTGKQQLLTVSASVSPQTLGEFALGGGSVASNSDGTVTVQPVADLGMNTISGPALVSNNGTATYTFTVTDSGPDDVSTAQVKGSFSGTGVTFTSAAGTSAFCSFTGQSFTCNLPLLKGSGGTNRSSIITLQGPATETNGKQTTLLLGALSGLNQIKVAPATTGDYSDATNANDAAGGQPFSTNVVPVAKLITAAVQTVPVSTTVANNTSGVKYQISVNNQGPDDLTNLTLSGTFSSTGVSLNSASIVDGVGSPIPGCVVNNPAHSYSCTGINIPNTATANFFLVGTVVETTGTNTPLTITAAIAPGTAGDFTPGSGSVLNAQAITNVQPHANISSVFTAKAPNPFASSASPTSQTYIVVATNSGPDLVASSLMQGSFATSNATVNITSVSGAGGDICTHTQMTYQCTLTSFGIGGGSSHSFTIIANVVLNPGSTSGSVTNNVTSIGPVNAGDFGNDDPQGGATSAFSAIQGQSNLAFNFSASSTTLKVGDIYSYTASVTNAAGASDAADVKVIVNLFPGQTFLPASSSVNCLGATTITCSMGTVVAGAPASVANIAILAGPALVPTSASGSPRQVAFSQGASLTVDTNQTVNIGASSAPAINLTARAAAHITVAHTNSTAPVLINGTGTGYPDVIYTTQVTNVPGANGSSVAQNVVITDTTPASSSATLKSVSITGSGNFCDPPSGGQITCHILSLASGGTETLSVTVTPVLSGNGSQTSITDLVSYMSSDVVDPGPPGGTTNQSTIPVQNTMTGGVLPLTDGVRSVAVTFGTVTTTGGTTFNTSSTFGTVNLPAGYPLGIQPAGALLYNFSTTATITTPTTFCINNTAQTFAKPERVRVFLVSAGAPLDITSSIAPGNPTPATGVTMACGRTSFSNGSLTLAMLEPANNAPVLNTSNASPVTPFPTQGVTGQIILDASSADDPDNNVCNGSPIISPIICRDKDQLTYRWTTSNPLGFTNANKNPIGATLTIATPSNIFLPLGKNQTITLTVTDQLGATATNSFVRNIVNTPALSVADVLPVDGEIAGNPTPVAVRFFNVAAEGVTKLNTQAAGVAPSGYRFGTNGVRYNISTDATINGNTQLCVDTSNQRFVKPERVRLIELAPTFGDVTMSISPVPTIPSKGQVVNQVCGMLSGFSTGLVQVAALEPVNNAPVIGLTFNLSASQDAGKGVTGNFVDLNLGTSFDPDVNPCNGNNSTCSDTPQLRFFVFGPFPGALQATSANPIIRNVSLPGGTTTVTIVAIDQTITVPSNAVINAPSDLANLPGAAGQNGLTTTQFPVTIDSTTPGGGSTGNTATILAGQSASFIFTPVSPTGGVLQGSGTLNLTCSNGPTTPSLDSLHITCAVTPQTFTIGSSSAPALLVSTAGATLTMAQPSPQPRAPLYAVWVAFVGMPFAGIVIISISSPRRLWLKILLGFGLLVLAVGSQVACGGGGSMAPSTRFSTPRGTYEIVVTGTQNGTALSKNSFTITVQ